MRFAGRCAGHSAARRKSAYFSSDFARTPGYIHHKCELTGIEMIGLPPLNRSWKHRGLVAQSRWKPEQLDSSWFTFVVLTIRHNCQRLRCVRSGVEAQESNNLPTAFSTSCIVHSWIDAWAEPSALFFLFLLFIFLFL